ncbi:MAG TPA: glycosyltransferase family 4 protein [Phenylobacterium sp.]
MRVLYSFPHAIGAPGIGTTAIHQVLGLLDRGHEVTVLATSLHKSAPKLPRALTTMSMAGLRLPHRIVGMDRAMAYHDRRAANHLRRHPLAFDIVHCWPGATTRTARAARAAGIASVREAPNTHTAYAYKVVGEVCDLLGMQLPRGNSHRLNVKRLVREDAEYREALRLLAPSDYVARTFIDRGFEPERLLRHSYGFDPQSFSPQEAPRIGPLHAVFMGSIGPRKGLHVALEAWRRAGAPERARFSIYGKLVDGYQSTIAPYLSLPGVSLCGFTADPAGALRASDVLVLPSFEEGSALVTYEAQGCGVAPLVSDASGAACTHNVTGLVHQAGNVDELAGHFRLLMDEPDRLLALRRNVIGGRGRLTWDAAAERLEGCYQMAREAAGRRAPDYVESEAA